MAEAEVIDYLSPDYTAVLKSRSDMLTAIRADRAGKLLSALRIHYRTHPWDFVRDWGMTFEPRNVERGLVATIPFVPWPKQIEYLQWLYGMWRGGQRGLVEKSRDCGVTWLSVGFAVSMMLFEPGFTTGVGSRKEDLVDKIGDSKSIFEKIRFFLSYVPPEFMPEGWDWRTCSTFMRVTNPKTGGAIIGEAGNNIGRGGRCSVYLVDEAAFVEHQDAVDAALSQNTNCQIDISTVNGSGNAFYRKRQRLDGTDRLFIFDWRDDPRKGPAWYDKQVATLDPVIVAQEIDRDYNAANDDAFIPAKWVAAAIDAHKVLGFTGSGIRATGFDPADTGDAKAAVARYGSVVTEADQISSGDITQAIPWAFELADQHRSDVFRFDADGMGAPAMKLALLAMSAGRMKVESYKGSDIVEDPEGKYGVKRGMDDDQLSDLKTNGDTFLNYRAQTWTWVRDRFKATFDAVSRAKEGKLVNADPDDLISISSECECLEQLRAEMSRPKRIFTTNGKIQVESKKEMRKRGVASPNLADALVIAFSARRMDVKARQPIRVNAPIDHMRI